MNGGSKDLLVEKWVKTGLSGFLILFLLPFSAEAFEKWQGIVNTRDPVFLIKQTGIGSDRSVSLRYGDKVFVLAEQNNWCFVDTALTTSPNRKGWIDKNHLTRVYFRSPQRNRVGEQKFLVIYNTKTTGANLHGKFYENGTIFKVIDDLDYFVTINVDDIPEHFERGQLCGNSDSPAVIRRMSWDMINDMPLRLDFENEYYKRYYHYVILSLYRYFWRFLIFLVVIIVLSHLIMRGKILVWAKILSPVFLLFGAGRGKTYKVDYLDQICSMRPVDFSASDTQFSFFVLIFFVFHVFAILFLKDFFIKAFPHVYVVFFPGLRGKRKRTDERREITGEGALMQGEEQKQELTPEIVNSNDFKKIAYYSTKISQGMSVSINPKELEEIKARFQSQWVWQSKRENDKVQLLVAHINNLIEYQKSQNRLENMELEKRVDNAKNLVELKRLEVEFHKLEQEMEEIKKPALKDSVKGLKEKLRLERKQRSVYLDNKVKSLRSECANNIKLKRELRRLLAEETLRICGENKRNNLTQEQIHELEDVEDYIQAKIDQL